jgi:DAACS family dicarboxylate/amino acid:cation (Na+ or H+) symporter
VDGTTTSEARRRFHIPLYVRVLIGVAAGIILGLVFEKRPYLFGLSNSDLNDLGLLVIRMLKALAVPLVLFAILDAFARTHISAKRGGRLILICFVNVSVAMIIGLAIMNTLRPGDYWRGRADAMVGQVNITGAAELLEKSHKGTLSFIKNVESYIPESLLKPFVETNIISVVLLGLLAGAALRQVKARQGEAGERTFETVEQFITAVYQMLMLMLGWIIQLVPFAVLGAIAKTVGASGLAVFSVVWLFLAVCLLGLGIHSLIYYPLAAWIVGRKRPAEYLGKGSEAIITGLSTNSSLATVPVTLRCLEEKMGVSKSSARLAACVGTNLNNDGITLYEAVAALFLTQASGIHLNLEQQIAIVLASIMAGAGVAGIPEAGLIVLPLVLGAAGMPETAILAWLPLIMTVDWIIARARSGVNVMSDMLVAILLDRSRPAKSESVAEDERIECDPQPVVGILVEQDAGR